MMRDAVRAFEQARRGKRLYALFGFDGYIDSLYAVVEKVDERGNQRCFHNSGDFLACLAELNGQSAERELKLKSRRAGGNAPLTALAAGTLGIDAHCIGYMGADFPEFERIRACCRTTSLGAPAQCMALEFANCKWMLSDCESLHAFGAHVIEETMGREALGASLDEAVLIALLNWAAMPQNEEVVRLLLAQQRLNGKICFIDFSDISGLSGRRIEGFMDVLRQLSGVAHVVVSVNEHEARSLMPDAPQEEAALLEQIHLRTGAQEVVLHAIDHAASLEGGVLSGCRGWYHPSPVITTGGGDHFNGGYCAGRLAGLSAAHRLVLGTAAALFYVSCGYSGTAAQMETWLDAQIDQMEEYDANLS